MINIRQYASKFFKLPKPEGKGNWISVRDSMVVHTRGILPTSLLEVKRPNEPKDLLEYRLANYRPITKHGINAGIDSVFRILMGSNYSIVPSPEIQEYIEDKEFSFLETKKPQNLDFLSVFFRHLLRVDFDDPNGYLVWMPIHPDDKSLAPKFSDPNKQIEVEPLLVPSHRIIDVGEDVFSYEAKERITLEVSKTQKRDEPVYVIITKEAIWQMIPFWNEKAKEVQYRLELWYNMSFVEEGETLTTEVSQDRLFPMPVHVLGGNNTLNADDVEFFESFFAAYLPFGDEAINLFSDSQAVNVRYNYPYVSIKGQKCYTCKGAGKVPHKEDTGKTTICQTCNGNKSIPVMSPFSQYIMEPPASGDNENFALADVVKFYHADVNILKNSWEVWNELLDKAEQAISVKFIEDAQSGVAKDIDRERKYEMLMNISHNLFNLIEWSLNVIQAYRKPFVEDRKPNIVKQPTSFSIKTVNTLSQELAKQQETSAPRSFIINTSRELAVKIFNENDTDTRIVEVLSVWDVLYGMTEQQISISKATGGATPRDVIRHTQGYKILATISVDDNFMELTTEEIITQAETALDVFVPVTVPIVSANGEITV